MACSDSDVEGAPYPNPRPKIRATGGCRRGGGTTRISICRTANSPPLPDARADIIFLRQQPLRWQLWCGTTRGGGRSNRFANWRRSPLFEQERCRACTLEYWHIHALPLWWGVNAIIVWNLFDSWIDWFLFAGEFLRCATLFRIVGNVCSVKNLGREDNWHLHWSCQESSAFYHNSCRSASSESDCCVLCLGLNRARLYRRNTSK